MSQTRCACGEMTGNKTGICETCKAVKRENRITYEIRIKGSKTDARILFDEYNVDIDDATLQGSPEAQRKEIP